MALRLSRRLVTARTIELGYGVSVTHRPFSYADLREVEATAHRLARESMPAAMAFEAALHDDEDLGPEHDEALRARAAQHQVKLLLLRFGESWEGLVAEDGTPAPLSGEALDAFFALFPGVTSVLHNALIAPWVELELEGNASAPLPRTATAEA